MPKRNKLDKDALDKIEAVIKIIRIMPAPKKKMITAKSQVRTVTQSQSGGGG